MQETNYSNGWNGLLKLYPDMPIHADGGPDILKWYYESEKRKHKLTSMEMAICVAYRDSIANDFPFEKKKQLLERFLKIQKKYIGLEISDI